MICDVTIPGRINRGPSILREIGQNLKKQRPDRGSGVVIVGVSVADEWYCCGCCCLSLKDANDANDENADVEATANTPTTNRIPNNQPTLLLLFMNDTDDDDDDNCAKCKKHWL